MVKVEFVVFGVVGGVILEIFFGLGVVEFRVGEEVGWWLGFE